MTYSAVWLMAGLVLLGPVGAAAQAPTGTAGPRDTRWAIVVSGASGGPAYAEQMASWRQAIEVALTSRFGFAPSQIVQLVDETARASGTVATAENVRKAFATLQGQVGKDDTVLIVLLGHGTFDGQVAKFNLVGPDLTAADWAAMLGALPGRQVVVNTTEASAPFLEALAASGRVVITATETAAQRYATVFPDYFVKALGDVQSDLDKNGRTSVWELFASSSGAVARHYTERAQLTTERAMLNDTGDKAGVQATVTTGPVGTMARSLYLDRDVASENADPAVRELIGRRRALETEAEAHIQNKPGGDPAEWAAEFERLMIELARVSREIRQRS
ncbi:MAG: caspase family protein [Acidobacteria bacterium]|nr:caspase family protein [Acidobacteriota bacterium]